MIRAAKTILTSLIISFPAASLAGGFGNTVVKDSTVGQSAAAADTVFCRALDSDIPLALASEMDCDVGTARRAPRRTGLFGFLTNPRNPRPDQRANNPSDDNDSPRKRVVVVDTPTDGGGPTGDETPGDGDVVVSTDPTDPPNRGNVSKWDRLSDFGINEDNLFDQPAETLQEIQDFRDANRGQLHDWSGFRPGQ